MTDTQLLCENRDLKQQLAAVTKERNDAVKVQVHMAKEYQTRLSAAQAEVEHLQNLIPDHIRSAIAAHGDSIGETLIKLTGDYSLLRAEVARLKRLSSEDACNIIGLSEDRDDLESRTARLKEALEKLLTQVLGEGMDMTAAIEQAQQALAEESGKCQ